MPLSPAGMNVFALFTTHVRTAVEALAKEFGEGAFVVPVRARSEFGVAIRRKLLLEISGIAGEPRIIHAQAPGSPAGRVDCMVGEQQWRRYMDGPYRN